MTYHVSCCDQTFDDIVLATAHAESEWTLHVTIRDGCARTSDFYVFDPDRSSIPWSLMDQAAEDPAYLDHLDAELLDLGPAFSDRRVS